MTERANELSGLSNEQLNVATLPIDSMSLVVASAGSGKTLVLANRIKHLLSEDDVGPGQILALSFSRAAVLAVRQSLAGVAASRAVFVRTFDSFCTQLLSSFSRDDAWMSFGYDQRVQASIGLLESSEDARSFIAGLKHILVDEVQDLVGIRSSFVTSLLSHRSGGFTLLGDPAQAIYGFAQGRMVGNRPQESVFAWVESKFAGNLEIRGLSKNFRARSLLAESVASFGPRLRASGDQTQVRADLIAFVDKLPPVSAILNARPMLTREDGTSIAILCRDNGQALEITSELSVHAIPHALQRSALSRAAPRWIAESLRGVESSSVPKETMMDNFAGVVGVSRTPEELWELLRRASLVSRNALDVRALSRSIRCGSLPDELYQDSTSSLTVSTIHRAKGLEFDTVFMAVNRDHSRVDEDIGEEARILYVGLSRARSYIFRLVRPAKSGLSKHLLGRWVQVVFRGPRRRVDSLEILGSDIDAALPAGIESAESTSVIETQRYIQRSVLRGDEVEFRLWSEGATDAPQYQVLHAGTSVGITSGDFAAVLKTICRENRESLPARLTGARVDTVDSVAGVASEGAVHGLGESGVWLRVRVCGLAALIRTS